MGTEITPPVLGAGSSPGKLIKKDEKSDSDSPRKKCLACEFRVLSLCSYMTITGPTS